MSTRSLIDTFLAQKHIAVAGVSRNPKKFGSYIYKALNEKGFEVYPINPNMDTHGGKSCYSSINDLPDEVTALAISTKPEITSQLLKEAKTKGIKHIWLLQGSADKTLLESVDTEKVITKECLLMHAQPVKGIHGFHRFLRSTLGKMPA